VTTVAFLVAHEGIEQVELTEPWKDVQDAGATPILVSTTSGEVQGFDHLDKADTFEVDHEVSDVSVEDFDVLVLPGGVANPDVLRMDQGAVALVEAALTAGKPVAAICHAPWMLVEADGVRGRKVTSWPSLRTDLINAGATWVDEQVVIDEQGAGPLITSRNPDDLEAFGKAVVSHLS
jgi:protease I